MQVGDIVDGRYRLLDLLGEGAAGKVFRAEDLGRNNMFVAVKLLHAKDPRWEGFFRREFEVLSRLHHPNLVRVFDFGPAPDENTWYFTQELVVGRPMLEAAAGKKLDEVIGLFVEVCRALEFIHGHGVLHRDLKPANILVQQHADPGERVRVLDFGLWRELDPTPQRGARWAGTPPYLASEVLRGFGHSISADLYAVGVTLFQVLTRKLPHGRGTPQELLAARKTPAPDLAPMVPKELASLLGRLLDEEPPRRPQTAAEVAAQLSQLIPNHALAMPLALGRARLVGREAERKRLTDVIEAVKEKRSTAPRLVVLHGPDGVGKSRFANEVKADVQLLGGRSAIGQCQEDARFSYRPISELVRAIAPLASPSGLSGAEREVIERLCPELLPGPITVGSTVVRSDKERFHGIAADLFLNLGKTAPLVLIVEDIQHCDQATAGVLAALLRRAKEAHVLVVVTATEANKETLPREIVEAAQHEVQLVELKPLPRDEVARLVGALLGVGVVPDALTDMLFAHSNGNPLMVEELLALLIDRGELQRGDTGWKLDDFYRTPSAGAALSGVLQERIKGLSDAERRALSALAVFNRPSGPKVLAAVSGLSLADVRQALSTAEGHGLVRVVDEEDGRPRVIFRHPHIKDALLQGLRERGELAAWHRTCAQVLEDRAGKNLDAMAETLAHHAEKAGDLPRALKFFLRAALYSIQAFAFDEALALARRAARLLPKAKAEPSLYAECDLLVGKSMLLAGLTPEAKAFLESAVARPEALVVPEAFGEMHVWLARAYSQLGAADQGIGAIGRALKQLSAEKNPVAAARVLLSRGELQQRSAPLGALADADEALRLFGRRLTIDDELLALDVTATAAHHAGQRDRAVDAAKRRLQLGTEEGRALDAVTARRQLAVAMSARGDRLASREHLNQGLKLAKESGHRVEEALMVKCLGDELWMSGAYAEAITRYQEAATLSAQVGQVADRAECLRSIGRCYVAKGDYDRAIDHLKAAHAALERAGDLWSQVSVRCDLAIAHLAKGSLDDSEELLREAAKKLPDTGLDHARAEVYLAQGFLFTARSDFERGRVGFLRAAALFRGLHRRYGVGEALTGLGQLLVRFGEHRRALRAARHAEGIWIDLDARGQQKRVKPLLNAAAGLAASSTPKRRSKP